jgi:hypothetical protein
MTTRPLFEKEFRECWKIGAWAFAVLLVAGAVFLRLASADVAAWSAHEVNMQMGLRDGVPGSLARFRYILPLVSVAMAIILAVRQFWIPFHGGEWGFLLHRPMPRAKVFWVKLGIAVLCGLPMVLVWSACCWVANVPGWYRSPPAADSFAIGLVLMGWGVLAYCAAADAALLHNMKAWRSIRGAALLSAYFMAMFSLQFSAFQTALAQCGLVVIVLVAMRGNFLKRDF